MNYIVFTLFISLTFFNTVQASDSSIDLKENITQFFPHGSVSRLHIENHRGSINIEENPTDEAAVKWFRRGGDTANIKAYLENGTLMLSNKKELNGMGSTIDWILKIPRNISLFVQTGLAQINLKDLEGEAIIEMGFGTLNSSAPLAKLAIIGGFIEAKIKDLAGDGSFTMGSGNLNIIWSNVPTLTQNIAFNFGNGTARIYAPVDTTVNLERLHTTPTLFGLSESFAKTSQLLSSAYPHIRITGVGGIGGVYVKKGPPQY